MKIQSFAEKVKNRKKTILYELLPPPQHLSKIDIDRSLSLFSSTLTDFPIDAVNIPEVREETRNGSRSDAELTKLDPRTVCSYLQRYHIDDLIINRPIVYLEWKEQKKWLEESHYKFNIQNLILVGGESSKIAYQGLSVIDATSAIKNEFPQLFLGGIILPSRRHEAERVLRKSRAGIEFFTTQILYESESIKELLKEYWALSQKEAVEPKMVFLSFAPITTVRDAELLIWLGTQIPKETLERITTGWLGTGWRSLKVCLDVLQDILNFVHQEDIHVPLGLNIEHINRHNFETSFMLVERLASIYKREKL